MRLRALYSSGPNDELIDLVKESLQNQDNNKWLTAFGKVNEITAIE